MSRWWTWTHATRFARHRKTSVLTALSTYIHTPTDEGTFGGAGWGARASEVLLQVRGKDFRHEKTKKKRGSYRGGIISMAVNSVKFD